MKAVNRDSVAALVLLAFTGAMWLASGDIANPGYQSLPPVVWPRLVLAGLAVMSAIYLAGAVRGRHAEPGASPAGGGLAGWLGRHRNPLACFGLFLAFLVTLPWLGMLLGGIAFVFAALTFLGGASPRALAVHAAIAVLSVGGMWAVFTYALEVMLPASRIPGLF